MKTEQIALALAIAREGSITKAAESLFISQPNASSLLIKLETEIGYRIFQREKGGMLLTDEGKVFLEQALHIEQALHTIIQAGQGIRQINFTVFSFQLNFSELAFEALCEKYHADCHAGQMRFQIIRNTDDTLKMIANGNGDVAIIMCLKKQFDFYERRTTQLFLESVPICECPMELTCKKGHPIIQNGKVHSDLLSDYPGFSGVSRSTLEPYLSFFDAELVGRTGTTYIMDPGPMRYRLLHKTGGFLFSLHVSDEIKETYDLESVPLKSMVLTVFAVYRRNSLKEPLINEYLNLCKSLCDDGTLGQAKEAVIRKVIDIN